MAACMFACREVINVKSSMKKDRFFLFFRSRYINFSFSSTTKPFLLHILRAFVFSAFYSLCMLLSLQIFSHSTGYRL